MKISTKTGKKKDEKACTLYNLYDLYMDFHMKMSKKVKSLSAIHNILEGTNLALTKEL